VSIPIITICKLQRKKSYLAFNIRLDPSLHQRLVAHAMDEGKTLNSFIKDTLEKAVSETHAS